MITYAIGDIHGRADLLVAAFDFMIKDAKPYDGPVRTVFLGDYIDRGPNSRGVLGWLIRAKESVLPGHEIVFLRGNHDDMMLKALRYRDKQMQEIWVLNGGDKTLDNYYGPSLEGTVDGETIATADIRLDMVAVNRHLDFIESMPLWYEDEHRMFVHAGLPSFDGVYAEPSENLTGRNAQVMADAMLWARCKVSEENYANSPKLVVHGHTPVKQAMIINNGLFLDTGACFEKGCLTVARFLDGDAPTFHEFRS